MGTALWRQRAVQCIIFRSLSERRHGDNPFRRRDSRRSRSGGRPADILSPRTPRRQALPCRLKSCRAYVSTFPYPIKSSPSRYAANAAAQAIPACPSAIRSRFFPNSRLMAAQAAAQGGYSSTKTRKESAAAGLEKYPPRAAASAPPLWRSEHPRCAASSPSSRSRWQHRP